MAITWLDVANKKSAQIAQNQNTAENVTFCKYVTTVKFL